jgi:hypothetical protein
MTTFKVKESAGQGPKWTTSAPNGERKVATTPVTLSGTVAQDAIIRLTADTATHFGDFGPELIYRTKLKNATAGTDYIPVDGVTVVHGGAAGTQLAYTGAYKFPVHSVAELPWGMGLVMGALDSVDNSVGTLPTLAINTREEIKEIFEYTLVYYPPANVAAAYDHRTSRIASQTAPVNGFNWQDKSSWWFRWGQEGLKQDDKHADLYYGFFGIFTGHNYVVPPWSDWTYPQSMGMTQSNHPAATYYIQGNPKAPQTVVGGAKQDYDGNSCRVTPWSRSWGCRMDVDDGYLQSRFVDSVSGVVLEETKTPYDFVTSCPKASKFSRNHWPGFIRGMNAPLGFNAYYAARYVATGKGPDGEGARARVMLTDGATLADSKKEAIFTVLHWTDKEIILQCELEMFWDQPSLIGKWLHVINYMGVAVGKVQL